MTDRTDVWYRIGYTLASLRAGGREALDSSTFRPRTTPERRSSRVQRDRPPETEAQKAENPFDSLIAATASAVAGRAVAGLMNRSESSLTRVVRAGLAGAAATLVLQVMRSHVLRTGDRSIDATAEVMAGAARGILYGSVVDPWLPGPGPARGALFGALEYTISPLGGLDRILGAASPHRTIPMLAAIMDTDDLSAETLLEHVVFGTTVGLLYGSRTSSNGTELEE